MSQRRICLPPELEEIYEPRHLEQEEDEDDETETTRALSEREKRELFRQHRNLGHPQPTELARALRHAGARREAIRFVLKELRCPTCEERPLPLPPRPRMLPRCSRVNQCIGVDLVDLDVRDGTSAKALNVVCWGTRAPNCGKKKDAPLRQARFRRRRALYGYPPAVCSHELEGCDWPCEHPRSRITAKSVCGCSRS